MPGFSAYAQVQAQPAAAVQQSGAINTFVLEWKNQPKLSDAHIISEQRVFIGNNTLPFKNVFDVTSDLSLAQFENLYQADTVYIEPAHTLKANYTTANDPGFSTDPTNVDRQWGLIKTHFPEAWDQTHGSSGVVVGIIDTGIDATHEDLSSGQVSAGFDFTTHSYIPIGTNSDDNGHGTLIAGIIGAATNNFRGIAGTNWSVTMMPLKALDVTGSGNSADVAAAIVWAADHGANVINLSLGGVGFSNDTTLTNAISYAYNKNVVIVAAAGNDVATTGGNMDVNPVFPVCDDNGQNMVIGVAATDVNDQKTTFSNYGHACVDISAPGKRILSTINRDPSTHLSAPNSYAYASGTSLAAPFVSGAAALIKARYPQASNKEIRDRLLKSADVIDGLNPTQCNNGSCAGLIGSGRLNVYAALNLTLPTNIPEGTLVEADNSPTVYLIQGGQKQPVSAFVRNQRYANVTPLVVPSYVLDSYQTGIYALPLEGTLVKTLYDNTVYEILGGLKRPVTYQIYLQRNIQPNQIAQLTPEEINSWLTGTFLPPIDGTLVRAPKNPTVYWVIDGLLHPINYQFWIDRGLWVFPLMIMSDNDIAGYAKGNAYIR